MRFMDEFHLSNARQSVQLRASGYPRQPALLPTHTRGSDALFLSPTTFRLGFAGIVLGARVPIALTSRADKPLSRMASCALAVLLSLYAKEIRV